MPIPGQRLAGFAEVWQKAGADPALLTLIRDGHKIIFVDGPPPCTIPSPDSETKLPDVKMNVIRAKQLKWHSYQSKFIIKHLTGFSLNLFSLTL